MERHLQVKKLTSSADFSAHVGELELSIDVDDEIDPAGPLAQPVSFPRPGGDLMSAPNRFAILPMEGWDGERDGSLSELVTRRWRRFAEGGAGLVWAEATAVVAEGRANPHQLVLTPSTAASFADGRRLFAQEQVVGLQLTHSGRWSRPDGEPNPRTAYVHPVLDARAGADESSVLTDGELEGIGEAFVGAAVLALEAGFDFVDLKACHGYLGHELLSGHDREGVYGGDFEGRTRFFTRLVEEVRSAAPGLGLALRLSVTDLVPFEGAPDGVGRPVDVGEYRWAFGADHSGLNADLGEPLRLVEMARALGVGLFSTTIGSPYYCPHAQRPAYFPPSDGYRPPEDPLVGVARHLEVTRAVAAVVGGAALVGSGYSYLQDWLPHVGQAEVRSGGTDLVGLGRMALSYPDMPSDVLAGRPLNRRLVCRTFSDCTTAPRAGLVSGCFPLDPFYKEHPQRVKLVAAKRAASERQA